MDNKTINKADNKIRMSINNMDVFYGIGANKKQALHDINLDIVKNKVTSLIGSSGCGKSTFLRCLNRMNDYV